MFSFIVASTCTALPSLSLDDGRPRVLDSAACPHELYCSEKDIFENLDTTKTSGPAGIQAEC